jgi:hypothetical protein
MRGQAQQAGFEDGGTLFKTLHTDGIFASVHTNHPFLCVQLCNWSQKKFSKGIWWTVSTTTT